MRKVRDVLRLTLGEGLSLRQTAAALQIPFTTVADHRRRAKAAGLSWPLPDGLDDDALEARLFTGAPTGAAARPLPDWGYIHRELRRPHVTLMLLWHEYRQSCPDGYAYSQFAERYRRWHRHIDVVMRQPHKAGEKLFVDFPGRRIPIYDEQATRVVFEAELFVAVLGASSYLYAEALASQELACWVAGHVHAFEHLGGVPALVVCDNLRSAVSRAHRYEPDVNATYQEMAAHYGTAILPARSFKPRDKAKAESGVLIAERWIMARLRDQRFTSLGEANLAIREALDWINDRPFQKIDGTRRSMFTTVDKPALRPLPASRYEFASWRHAKVNIDYHVEIRAERHYYSVPYRLVGEVVDLRITASTVEFFHRHRRVAAHPRAFTPGFSTDPAHMPESHRRHAAWTPGRIIAWAATTGPATAALVEAVLAARPHPEQGFRSCLGIVRLGDRYGAERLEAACVRALAVRAHSYRSVASILSTGLDRRPVPGQRGPATHPAHDNLRGPDYYR